ncbi:tyrosine-type recombinase/integrase [Nocardioides sp.]|uniref:tyrosine-type recombinase/integrase n=1 Tax=Nocardioides sp. TaxID=35761 RepID=UPI003516BBBF
MTGRPRQSVGTHGSISFRPKADGYMARTRVRDRDGRTREVTATGKTKGSAERALKAKLEVRRPSTPAGLQGSMTMTAAADYWFDYRASTGRAGQRTPIKPQTLATYKNAMRLAVLPALGGLRLDEVSVPLLDEVLRDLEAAGTSTMQARSILNQIFGLAVRHGVMSVNPMSMIEKPARENGEIEILTIEQVHVLRHVVRPDVTRKGNSKKPNGDLRDVVDGLLGTGCRIGELLSLHWDDIDLESATPTAHIAATLVEPRKEFGGQLTRQESTKSRGQRTLILPDELVDVLNRRRDTSRYDRANDPVFASSKGTYLWPNNIRTRLRAALEPCDSLVGTTPHTLRRSVATLIAHTDGFEAAREQLGHAATGTTARYYVAPRVVAPDVRKTLSKFFVTN